MSAGVNIKPLTAILVVAFFLLLLGARFWAYGESISVPGFSYLHKHPSGDTVLLFHGSLYRFDDANQLHSRTTLSDIGVPEDQITDFAWFSNGDLLLRRGQREEGLLFNLERYQRKTNSTPPIASDPQATLIRCVESSGVCRPFADPPLNLNDVFALEIDTQTDRVFVADTGRHKVYMLSAQGKELDSIDTGLKFPNQISYIDDTLYITNTNRNQLSAYRITENSFSSEPETISVTPEEAVTARQIWPAAQLFYDDTLWVINVTNRMDQGGIYLFDTESDDYDYSHKAVLGDDADPVAMIRHGDNVLVSDLSHDRIYEMNQDGQLTGEFLPPWLSDDVMQVKAERTQYQQLTTVLTGLFIFSLVAGFAYALYLQLSSSGKDKNVHEPDRVSLVNINDPDILWIAPDLKTQRTLYALPLIIVGLLFAILALRSYMGNINAGIDSVTIISVAVVAIILFMGLRNSLSKRIGILGDSLILMDSKGRYSAGSGSQIQYSDAVIVIGKQFVLLGGQPKIFPTKQMILHVYPLLKEAEFITASAMQMMLLRRSKPFLFVMVLTFAGLIGALVYLMR